MRPFRVPAAAGWLLALALLPGAAAADTNIPVPPGAEMIDCHLDNPQFLISKRMVFVYQPQLQDVRAIDGAIDEVYHRLIPVDVEEDTAQHLVMAWTVKNLQMRVSNGGTAPGDIHYNATFVKGPQSVVVTAKVLNFENPLSQSTGTCTVRR